MTSTKTPRKKTAPKKRTGGGRTASTPKRSPGKKTKDREKTTAGPKNRGTKTPARSRTTPKKQAPPTKPTRKKPGRRRTRGHNEIIIFLLVICGAVTVLIGAFLAWFLSLDIPDIRSFDDYHPLVTTTLLDKNGAMIEAIYEENRIVLPFEKLNPRIPEAFVAAEDGRYWEHPGLDTWSILRALINNLRTGRRGQGGSTITQQVTRGLMLSREKSYSGKIKEAILAYRLNKMLSKEDILAIYLSEIYLGEGAYGVEAAARTYFNKPSARLNLAEVALLAGLPQSPSRYSPLTHFDRARARQRYVLNRMAEEGYISPEEARTAYATPLRLNNRKEQQQRYGYFSRYVRGLLEKEFGRDQLLRRGLVVTTTLDPRLQEQAVKAVQRGAAAVAGRGEHRIEPQGALVALERKTGRIRALVGGTDFQLSPFNRAVQARRQPGSVFKPLVYAAAFTQGLTPDTIINDAPLSIRNPDGSAWTPHNWSNKHYGPTTLADGLVFSRNIVAIKLLRRIGTDPVIRLAQQAGITSPLEPDLTLALGSSPVTLLEMTGAYTIFADQGVLHRPVAVTSVRDRRGRELDWPRPEPVRVLDPEVARRMTGLLAQVIERGTGRAARGIPASGGKTGTTDNNQDAWFIGYTPELVTGVWLGHDRNRSLGRGETGGRAAAPVWRDFMKPQPEP